VGFIDLVGYLFDDDHIISMLPFLDFRYSSQDDFAAPGFKCFPYSFHTIDDTAGWKIRCFDIIDQFSNSNGWVFNRSDHSVNDFRQIMWKHIGGHTNSNSTGAINEQVRDLCREDRWFFQGIIE